jgi:hypothetical protein
MEEEQRKYVLVELQRRPITAPSADGPTSERVSGVSYCRFLDTQWEGRGTCRIKKQRSETARCGKERLFATKASSVDLEMNRANEYATPTHDARTTNAYSVSFPV